MKHLDLPYIESVYGPSRRKTTPVQIGNTWIGGDHPVLVQSMVNTLTKDINATVEQTLELANAGCELVRITAPTAADAACLEHISKKIRAAGCTIPLSADIHFQPRAAMEAVKWVEKVRINPGNYVDKGVLFMQDWTPEEWSKAEQRVYDEFSPLVRECKNRGVALRIGTNHGSLSNRMVWKFGDSVEGMVESALEYLRVCEDLDFHNIVFSMKASNPKVVIEAYRLLAARLDAEHRAYPFHVGVTEAGEGEDGRLKSAVGIGALLLDGIGDTIRVSLTEHPVVEIPVAQELIRVTYIDETSPIEAPEYPINPYYYTRRSTTVIPFGQVQIGGTESVKVGTLLCGDLPYLPAERPLEWIRSNTEPNQKLPWISTNSAQADCDAIAVEVEDIDSTQLNEICLKDIESFEMAESLLGAKSALWSIESTQPVSAYRALVAKLHESGRQDPILLRAKCKDKAAERMLLAAQMGSLLCDGIGDLLYVEVENHPQSSIHLAYDILQATGLRRTKTEFVSCPSCGRTLFDLEEVTAQIKAKTGHLKDLAIAIMGCIVNGPGEMADADFGYVGGAPGKISLYVGKECVQKNIPESEALDALIQLIKAHGKWQEPLS